MRILVFNAGSSSLKFGVFDLARRDSRVLKGEFDRFDQGQARLRYRLGGEEGKEQTRTEEVGTLEAAVRRVPQLLDEFGCDNFQAVGHRVVHGGEHFRSATLLTDAVVKEIDNCSALAPLHNPVALNAIQCSQTIWPDLPQVAVFDTAFHASMPAHVRTYAVPLAWRQHGVRRYGFHGTSHQYVAQRAAEALGRPLQELRLISCHLGNGASVCAIAQGASLDTSMGMTPLEGLVMGTRSGDIDPGLCGFLQRELGLDAAAVEDHLQNDSGLLALCGTADMRDIEARAARDDADAVLALQVHAYRVRKYIGAYAAALGGLDAVVFTGGIGENSAGMRQRICERLEFLGLLLDQDRNRAPVLDDFAAPLVSAADSRVAVLVTCTNEQFMIAREVQHLLQDMRPKPPAPCRIPVAVSGRHIHPSRAAIDALFGPGHELAIAKMLTQDGSWAAQECVELIGPRGRLVKVRLLGPPRERTQIEVSRTDALVLGLDPPVRASGKLDNTPEVTLRGPAGDFHTDGLIIAGRHVHMSPEDGQRLGLQDGDLVDMQVGAGPRALSFANTLVRIKAGYVTEMHIDTDEANAAGIAVAGEGDLNVKYSGPDADMTSYTAR